MQSCQEEIYDSKLITGALHFININKCDAYVQYVYIVRFKRLLTSNIYIIIIYILY